MNPYQLFDSDEELFNEQPDQLFHLQESDNDTGDHQPSEPEASEASDSENEQDVLPVFDNRRQVLDDTLYIARSGRVWDGRAPNIGRARAANLVRQQRRLQPRAREIQNPLNAFRLFLSEQIVDIIVRETNRKARAVHAEWNLAHPEEQKEWTETNDVEMEAFIGLLLLAGMFKSMNESLDELWSSETGRAIFRATMRINRFLELLRFIRFDNFNTRQERLAEDKLAAFRDIWALFLALTREHYIPGPYLTVDEQLVSTRGRCNFRQYIPSKPGKYGIKIFWVCDAQNSFPLNAEIYLGRQPGAARAEPNYAQNLVQRLTQHWQNHGRNITLDNFFTSVALAEQLLVTNTTLVGTIRQNRRDIPQEFLPNRRRPIESSLFGFDQELTLVSYVPKKNKAVLLLSSMHHDNRVDPNNHGKPDIVLFYNDTKSGVDNLDHLVRIYSCKRKTNRWPLTLFFNMLDCAGVAAYNIWLQKFPDWNRGKHNKRRLFLKELGRALVQQHIERRLENPRALQRGVRAALSAIGIEIQPAQVAGPNRQERKRCAFCTRERDRKTPIVCVNCQMHCCPEHQIVICPACHGDI